jgi:hypothetical protein
VLLMFSKLEKGWHLNNDDIERLLNVICFYFHGRMNKDKIYFHSKAKGNIFRPKGIEGNFLFFINFMFFFFNFLVPSKHISVKKEQSDFQS